ncbi:hypothetical protein [Tenacibaculum mesophilum]|uniref:hypothetical protein n=1 Tax=Tenacibaculum mesophilum TaxID=104268 RepID=UPI00069D811D|nr:hypothetical protein [Tenacibaculum mesophilum]
MEKKLTLSKLILIVIIVWGLSGIIIWLIFNDWDKSATFGDTFGFINSLFSGLALAAIIFTIHLQKNELALQRKELEFTRKELSRSANAHEHSLKMMNEQLRISSLPIFEYYSQSENGKKFIIISNNDNNPAFDIDIWIFKPVSKKNIKLKEFIAKFIKKERVNIIELEKFTNKELFYICERGVYNSFPKNKKIMIPIDYPFNDEDNDEEKKCELFFQYKDALNNNYIQCIEFKSKESSVTPYEYSIFTPSIPTVENKIELIEYFRKQNKNVPTFVDKYFEMNNNSISASLIIGRNSTEVEGKWKLK